MIGFATIGTNDLGRAISFYDELLGLIKKSGKENLSTFHQYLKDLSLNLPINHIYNTMSSRPKEIQQEEIDFKKIKEALEEAWKKDK